MTHKGTKRPRVECLSISHIPTGGVIIDSFLVARFSFGKPSYSKCECSTLQIENKLIINCQRLYLDISVSI